MSNDMNKKVIHLLNEYPAMIQKRDILRYEMQHPALVSDQDMLDAMSYFHGEGAGTPSGGVSDRTLYIAMNFREKAKAMNTEIRKDIVQRLLPLEREIERLEFYVKMLPDREQNVIRMLFFEGMNQQQAAKELGVSTWTVRKYQNDAIDQLAKMYAFAEGKEEPTS